MKRCSKCCKIKLSSEFNRNKARSDGLQDWCRACHQPRVLEANRKRLYGVADKQHFMRIVDAQDGKCRVCNRRFVDLKGEPHVDHDHAFGVIRGVLCRRCNIFIGALEKNRSILVSALDYVQESENPVIGGAS